MREYVSIHKRHIYECVSFDPWTTWELEALTNLPRPHPLKAVEKSRYNFWLPKSLPTVGPGHPWVQSAADWKQHFLLKVGNMWLGICGREWKNTVFYLQLAEYADVNPQIQKANCIYWKIFKYKWASAEGDV